jgi:hypothetical protein
MTFSKDELDNLILTKLSMPKPKTESPLLDRLRDVVKQRQSNKVARWQ